jgi:hypothetical protein
MGIAVIEDLAKRFNHPDRVAIFELPHRARDFGVEAARRRHDEPLNPGALAINHQPL